MVTAVTAVTVLVVTGNVFVVAPAATVTETGTVAAALLLVSITTAPATGAALLSVTVPVLPPTPPVTAVGFTLTPFKAAAGFSVIVEILDAPRHVAVMLTCVTAVTVLVLTVNVFVVAPAATVTETGTVTAALLLVSVTIAPPAGAALLSVTVPVLSAPPISTEGLNVNEPSSVFTTSPTCLEM